MVAYGHRPIYTTSVGDSVVSVAQDVRNALEATVAQVPGKHTPTVLHIQRKHAAVHMILQIPRQGMSGWTSFPRTTDQSYPARM